jgi:hypothetical protein
VRLLQQLGIFPLKEFDNWDAITLKTYPALNTFIHEAYTRRLMALQLRNTTGTRGYAPIINQNMYNVLDKPYKSNSKTDGTVMTQTAPTTQTVALSMGSTLANTYGGGTTYTEITKAINQLSANQQSIMTQMAAMSFNNAPVPPPQAAANFHFPPIQQLNIPPFAG